VVIIGCETDKDVEEVLKWTDPDATFVATSWRELPPLASSAEQLIPQLRVKEVTGDILMYSDAVPPQARLPAGVVVRRNLDGFHDFVRISLENFERTSRPPPRRPA
jgi:hypothetical protein